MVNLLLEKFLKKMKNHQKSRKDLILGQGLLEFALVLPIMVLILIGLIDLGRAFFVVITLENSAREGSRYGSLYPSDLAGAKAAAVSEANGSGLKLTASNVTAQCIDAGADGKCDSLKPITVTVTYNFDLIMGWILPSPLPLTRDAVMLVP